jgi:hypothetical protein
MSQEKLQAFAEAVSKSEELQKRFDSGGSGQNDR